MTKQRYLRRFSRAVRWRLPPREAEEAIADYRELIFQEEREESRLVEELGEPVQSAHLLTDVRAYRRWLAVFGVLAFGLFLLAKWCFTGRSSIYLVYYDPWWYPVWVLAVGLALSLYWFRRHGQKNGPLSKRLVLALAVVLIAGCGVMYGIWDVTGAVIYEQVSEHRSGLGRQAWMLGNMLMYGGVFCALAALTGLVLAKCYDRRWLALYVLGVTVAAMMGFVTFQLKSMDVSSGATDMLRSYLIARLIPIGAAGLVGTGVALC